MAEDIKPLFQQSKEESEEAEELEEQEVADETDENGQEEARQQYLKKLVLGSEYKNMIKAIPLRVYIAEKNKKISPGYYEALNNELKLIIDKSIARSKKKVLKSSDL